MNLEASDLLPDERFSVSKNANAVIKISDYGLTELPAMKQAKYYGFGGKEAIGGKLHLSNYRLLFKSHQVNRAKGQFSVFLPTVQELQDRSRLLSKQLHISTPTQRFEFVVWGVPELIANISDSKRRLTAEQVSYLRDVVPRQYGEEIGRGLQVDPSVEKWMKRLPELADLTQTSLDLAQDTLGIVALINVIDLINSFPKGDQ